MAKKNEGLNYQKLISEICEILQVDDTQVVEAVKQYVQAARRPVVAAAILLDPLLKEPKVVFMKNSGEVNFGEAEYTLSAATDVVKSLKAQDMLKRQAEEQKSEGAVSNE